MCPTKRPYMVYHIYAVLLCYIVDLCYGVNPCYVVNICHSSYPYYSIMLLVIVEEAHSAKSYLYWILLQISIWKTITSMINKANLWGISVLRLTLMIELKVVTKTRQWETQGTQGHRDTGTQGDVGGRRLPTTSSGSPTLILTNIVASRHPLSLQFVSRLDETLTLMTRNVNERAVV